MELREYLRILLKRAWLILPLTFIATALALWFSYQQTPIYAATSTYVARLGGGLSTAENDTLIYGIDTLSGRDRISVTYCQVITSQSVRERAFQLIGLNPKLKQFEKYEVSCANLPNTNVLSLTVQGPSPDLALRLNEAIGLAGMERANPLYNSFPLENLDPPELQEDPVSPKTTLNAVLGGVLGLVVGVTLALTFEYLRTPSERLEGAAIRDLRVGTYNERYFRQRFEEETNRPYARLRPISMALLRLTPNEEFDLLPEATQTALLRSAALAIQDTIRQRSDIIAYLEPWTFGILLTETPGDEARGILQKLHSEIRARPFEFGGYVATFVASTGIVATSGDAMTYREILDKAHDALAKAESQGENSIHLITTMPGPFVQGGEEVPYSQPASGAVFNVSEENLFGSSPSAWDTVLNAPDVPAEPAKEEKPSRRRPRNPLAARAMQQQEPGSDSERKGDR